jgi:N-acetylmuramic acid 6-phosphate (MurNAc-6-P) etherase
LEVAATRGLEVAAASDLEVAAMAGSSSVDAEVALGSEAAEGSEVAGAAAARSLALGSMTSGPMIGGGLGGLAAHPGERAACAKVPTS